MDTMDGLSCVEPLLPNSTQPYQTASPPQLAALLDQHPNLKVLVVCPDANNARDYHSDLSFFAGNDAPIFFPDWESLPYDAVDISPTTVVERLTALQDLIEGKHVLITTAAAALLRLPPREQLQLTKLHLRVDDQWEVGALGRLLSQGNYSRVGRVQAPGEYAQRGAILDFYPFSSAQPVRLEFLDDSIERMRFFDPTDQRSLEEIDSLDCTRGHELPMATANTRIFQERFRARFDIDERDCEIFQHVRDGQIARGLEYYSPLFFESMAILPEYFSSPPILMMAPGTKRVMRSLLQIARDRYAEGHSSETRPLLKVDECWCDESEIKQATIPLGKTPVRLTDAQHWRSPHVRQDRLEYAVKALPKSRVLVVVPSAQQVEPVQRALGELSDITPTTVANWSEFAHGQDQLAISHGPLCNFWDSGKELVVGMRLETEQIEPDVKIGNKAFTPDFMPGDFVVHPHHGVGNYQGLEVLEHHGHRQECAVIGYLGGTTLSLPIEDLHTLTLYQNIEDDQTRTEPDRIGGQSFSKARSKAEKRAKDDAAMLLERHALRSTIQAPQITCPPGDLQAFCDSFSHRATDEQNAAVTSILTDMEGPAPMQRLLTGDVGFGKTEVAMRAIYACCQTGYQACLIAPTKLLCRQHYQTAEARFLGWGMRIAVISSVEKVDRQAISRDLAEGKIDLLVSTQALMRGKYQFKRCGLIVIDEEHRFGVADKERIHILSSGAHCLKMSATPIPRSLAQALGGVTPISMLTTPLPGRLPITTEISTWNANIVRDAIRRELSRGGQVMIVHDRVADLEDQVDRISALVPEASMGMAHGQMNPARLRQTIDAFRQHQIQILVSTTIVESGLDIPNVNTAIVTRADRIGLAQLHQIRGRIGRGSRRAWCWFLYPTNANLSHLQTRRLQAVANASELGAGFQLAQEDMDIRGAGELLGHEQSGHIQRVGLRYYLGLLRRAIEQLQSPQESDSEEEIPSAASYLDLGDEAMLPETYIDDPLERLMIYRRLARTSEDAEVEEIRGELEDRFGRLPEAGEALVRNTLFRHATDALGITDCRVFGEDIILELGEHVQIDTRHLAELAVLHPYKIRIRPNSICLRHALDAPAHAMHWFLRSVRALQ